tara:strand:- start:419 stop:1072 length:654 start_codon:yes stop_codon:yes gene_type:complete
MAKRARTTTARPEDLLQGAGHDAPGEAFGLFPTAASVCSPTDRLVQPASAALPVTSPAFHPLMTLLPTTFPAPIPVPDSISTLPAPSLDIPTQLRIHQAFLPAFPDNDAWRQLLKMMVTQPPRAWYPMAAGLFQSERFAESFATYAWHTLFPAAKVYSNMEMAMIVQMSAPQPQPPMPQSPMPQQHVPQQQVPQPTTLHGAHSDPSFDQYSADGVFF